MHGCDSARRRGRVGGRDRASCGSCNGGSRRRGGDWRSRGQSKDRRRYRCYCCWGFDCGEPTVIHAHALASYLQGRRDDDDNNSTWIRAVSVPDGDESVVTSSSSSYRRRNSVVQRYARRTVAHSVSTTTIGCVPATVTIVRVKRQTTSAESRRVTDDP